MRYYRLILALFLLGCVPGLSAGGSRLNNFVDWGIYRGDQQARQFSELAYVHAANAHRLEVVWEHRTGEATKGSSMQCNPIVVDGLMYIATQERNAVALNARTGEEVWRFDASKYNEENRVLAGRIRGVTYWEDDQGTGRIFNFVQNRIYALDAETGALITSFGVGGHIDLREDLGIDPSLASVEVTTPGAVYKDFLIVSSRVPEGFRSTPGHIRAYDAKTGDFRWVFKTIPDPGEFGSETWERVEGETYGGANAWGGLTIDEQRGWAFAATGSPTYDFYGAYRKGDNLFGNCVLALDATTGERIWHYQTVRHDLWDYDNPSAPILATIGSKKKPRDVVVQLTKMGLTFVLDRETGEPVFPVVELAVPQSSIPGEQTSPTQPFPLKPPPLVRLNLTEADLTNITLEARANALERFRNYVSGPIYTPPTVTGTLTTPGLLGGVEWHGASFDGELKVLYVNANDAPSISKLNRHSDLDRTKDISEAQLGSQLYLQNCTACHGIDRQGVPPTFPPLRDIALTEAEITDLLQTGRGLMPAFPQFSPEERESLVAFLKIDTAPAEDLASESDGRVRYLAEGYHIFRDASGVPAISPPWGTLNAIDLERGELLWKVPLGEYPDLAKKGIRNTGAMNFGGAVATSGGVLFIAATPDEKIRAFETHTGKVLWEHALPAGGYATPTVYAIDGVQYITIAAGGGGKNGTKSGDSIVTFALGPEPSVAETQAKAGDDGWISLFDGKTLEGWAHMNGSHRYTVEDGAIVGRTVAGSENSFLCSLQEFDDFELVADIKVDDVTNSGIQFRSKVKPLRHGPKQTQSPGRVYGPQVEIRRNLGPNSPTTGVIYGEALGTGWLSSEEKMRNGHDYYINDAWNHLRLVAKGPRIQTWLNGQLVEDLVREDVYATNPRGFIGLQIHGVNNMGPFEMSWKNIKVRPLVR